MASKSADVRPKITLACVECKERNYITKKNRRNNPDRLEMKKFCPRDGRHTVQASVILGRTSLVLLATGLPSVDDACRSAAVAGAGFEPATPRL